MSPGVLLDMESDGALNMEAMEESGKVGRGGLLAAGGLAPATLSMACCILPFVFVILGVTGSWMAYLTALSPYQPLFLGLAAAFIARGLSTAYRPAACADGTCTAPVRAQPLVGIALWLAAAQVITAVAVNLLAPHFL